jgi:trehalose/maltose hydrolase-like predicted phosphorylase
MRQDAGVAARPSRSGVPGLPTHLDRRFEAAVVVVGSVKSDLRAVVDELARFAFDVVFVSAAADSLPGALEELGRRGLGGDEVLVVDDESAAAELLDDQLRRRREGEVPVCGSSPAWTVGVDGFDPTLERAHETLLTLADGRFGTRGAPLVGDTVTAPQVLASGVYDGEGAESRLLTCPIWSRLDPNGLPPEPLSRVLDLRTGLLFESAGDRVRAVRFASAARPGIAVLRAEERGGLTKAPPLVAPRWRRRVARGESGGRAWISVAASTGGVVAAAAETAVGVAPRRIERLAGYASDPHELPDASRALTGLRAAEEAGFEQLLREQRREWADRWEAADVRIDGDDELQRAVRFALFHLMASVAEEGETALGARGLSGPGYRGHVFWDTDVFVLPFLAATRPQAARTILEYRVRRLPAARAAARALGRAGARFPWESARTGREVTPSQTRMPNGEVIPILTGKLEEHIVADVAWAAACYLDWTGDEEFLEGPGRELIVETARYWASRVRVDAEGRGHIDDVIGPDEYHEGVDDNAFTNVMARWNLRRAAALAGTGDERESWLDLAERIVDGYDERTGLYEQFAGFFELEPLVIAEMAPRRPLSAELFLGRKRVQAAQVVKQTDVLMLHHLVPGEVAPGSLLPNLEFYEPRTAHGSSLSPGTHAGLFARAGMLDKALEWLRLTSRIDLDDVTQTTAAGLHTATMGSLWQALAYGFAGVRPEHDSLAIDPRLPGAWHSLEVRVSFRGTRLTIRIEPDALVVTAEAPVALSVGAERTPIAAQASRPVRLERRGAAWKEVEA